MKKIIYIFPIIVFVIALLIIYPSVEIQRNNKLYIFSYSEDFSEWEDNMCYQESYSYNKEKDISIYNWDFKKFWIFKVLIMEYKNGNLCDTEYLLEESYIKDFIKNAVILENESNINLEKLIENRRPIVGNKRYFTDEDKYQIFYKLNGEEKEMFVFYKEDLLIIQVGLSDEGPKYIAYK